MDLHLFPVLCRVINSGFEKPAVQLIFDKNQKTRPQAKIANKRSLTPGTLREAISADAYEKLLVNKVRRDVQKI
jgi:hypothetical protein